MSGILYGDATAAVIARLRQCLSLRLEPYATAEVSNAKSRSDNNAVTVRESPIGGEDNTINTFSVKVNVFSRDEGTCADLANLVRAILCGTAPQGVVDGDTLVGAAINTGPYTVDDAPDGWFQRYMLIVYRQRGVNL